MPIPDDIIQNDFLTNLGDDFVAVDAAVDAAGHIVGRAATSEALLHAHAEGSVKIYSAADFADAPEEPAPVITATDDVVALDADAPKKPRKKSPAA